MRGIRILALACLLLTVTRVVADDSQTYDVKLDRTMRVGQVVKVEGERHDVIKTYVFQGQHQMLLNEQTKDLEYAGERKILAVDAGDDPSAIEFRLTKFKYEENGRSGVRLQTGITIKATRDGKETKYECDRVALTPEIITVLEQFLDVGESSVSAQEAFGPSKPMRIGETWDVNSEKCAQQAREHDLDIRAEDLTGTGRITELKAVDGIECMAIDVEVTVTGVEPPMPPEANAEILEGTMTMTVTGFVPFDDTTPEPMMTGGMTADTTMQVDIAGERKKMRSVLNSTRKETQKDVTPKSDE